MKSLLEFLPLALFASAFFLLDGDTVSVGQWSHTFDGIYSATAVLMISTAAAWAIVSILQKKNDRRLMWMTVLIVPLGGATLILRDPLFIQWKPTVFNWGLAIIVMSFQIFGKQTLVERMLGSQMTLPHTLWTRINMLWCANFTIVGAANLYVAVNYSEAFWVAYKIYSSFGFTLVVILLTILVALPHLKTDTPDGDPQQGERSR